MEPVLVHQSLQELLPVYGNHAPNATAQDVIKALEVSSSHYYTKNERIGYGIPNMKFARFYLSSNPGNEISVYPNPFPDHLIFFLPDDNTTDIQLELRDMYGRSRGE